MEKRAYFLAPWNAIADDGEFRHYPGLIGLVYSIHGSTEVAIQKMIDHSRRMKNEEEGKERSGLYLR
jgi:hypothetical protein